MTLDLSGMQPTAAPPFYQSAYASADSNTDMRRMFAGMQTEATGGGTPTRTTSGEWMIRITLDLPYAMLASLEAKAESEDIGDLIRAVLVTAGHGSEADVTGIRSDRYATDAERRAELGMEPRS
jgi:hypothetical protein